MYATTEKEVFAIDAATCAERWRIKEDVADTFLKVNRGAAFSTAGCFAACKTAVWLPTTPRTAARDGRRESPTPNRRDRSRSTHRLEWHGLYRPGWRRQLRGEGPHDALDATSGKQLWETWLVPREEQRTAPTTPTAKVAAPTWGNAPKIPIGGGATWTS